MSAPNVPSIFGRERALIEAVAKQIHGAAKKRHRYTELKEERRGYTFEVQVEVDGEATGHVARITIDLDRLETIGADLRQNDCYCGPLGGPHRHVRPEVAS